MTQRGVRNAWIAIGWFGVAMVIVLSLIPSPPTLPVEQGDKFEHVAAYGSLMFWFAQAYLRWNERRWIAAALVALGIGLEYVQGWTGWRDFSYADMAADAIGVALGWLVARGALANFLACATRWFARAR